MNKIPIIGAVIVVVILLGVVFLNSDNSSSMSGNTIKNPVLTEKEKYAKFEAEVACAMVDIVKEADEGETFLKDSLKIIQEVSAKYGYTASEIEANKAKYENDEEFQNLAKDYVFEICPEIAFELQNNN